MVFNNIIFVTLIHKRVKITNNMQPNGFDCISTKIILREYLSFFANSLWMEDSANWSCHKCFWNISFYILKNWWASLKCLLTPWHVLFQNYCLKRLPMRSRNVLYIKGRIINMKTRHWPIINSFFIPWQVLLHNNQSIALQDKVLLS